MTAPTSTPRTRWYRRPAVVGYLLLSLAFIIVLARQEQLSHRQDHERDQRITSFLASQKKSDRDRCESQLEGRGILRALVIIATEQGGFDFTKLSSFQDLDAATKAFFQELADLSKTNSGDSSTFRQQALELLKLPDCDGDGKPDKPPDLEINTTTTTTTG